MARIANELIERIKREVPMAELCREYGIELKPQGATQIYTQVSIQQLKQVHSATPPARLERNNKARK